MVLNVEELVGVVRINALGVEAILLLEDRGPLVGVIIVLRDVHGLSLVLEVTLHLDAVGVGQARLRYSACVNVDTVSL